MINLRKIIKKFKTFSTHEVKVCENQSLKERTTFRVGKNAAVILDFTSKKACRAGLEWLFAEHIDFLILGGGSNIIAPNSNVETPIVSAALLNKITCKPLEEDKILICCEAGVDFNQITEFCVNNNISGLETFCGLPGTVGGAVFMNARCYETSISDIMYSACFIEQPYTDFLTYTYKASDWEYKKSPFQSKNNAVILESCFIGTRGNAHDIAKKSEQYKQDRVQKGHFRYPSAGSIFKNNHAFGKPSGKLIDEAGLRGFSSGDAQIAPWHGNFIINLGSANADNIKDVVLYIQKIIKKNTGFDLECEVIFW